MYVYMYVYTYIYIYIYIYIYTCYVIPTHADLGPGTCGGSVPGTATYIYIYIYCCEAQRGRK